MPVPISNPSVVKRPSATSWAIIDTRVDICISRYENSRRVITSKYHCQHAVLPGRGVPCLAAFMCSSTALSEKTRVISCVVGGGIGYLPIASSTNDRPIDQMSDCTAYGVPCRRSGCTKTVNAVSYTHLTLPTKRIV